MGGRCRPAEIAAKARGGIGALHADLQIRAIALPYESQIRVGLDGSLCNAECGPLLRQAFGILRVGVLTPAEIVDAAGWSQELQGRLPLLQDPAATERFQF